MDFPVFYDICPVHHTNCLPPVPHIPRRAPRTPVMQDEMYTMKLAFEAKLKCKADEVSALAQRHAMEINRIQANSSPYVRR